MKIEKVGTVIKNYFSQYDLFCKLMPISEFILYAHTIMFILNEFISLGGLVMAVLHYSLYIFLLLAFAQKKYIGLIVNFIGLAFVNFIILIKTLVFTHFTGSVWEWVIGIIFFSLLSWGSIVLFNKKDVKSKKKKDFDHHDSYLKI